MAAGGRRPPIAGSGPPQPHSPVVLGGAQPTWRALGEEPTEGHALVTHLLCRVPAEPATSGVAPDRTHSMCSKGPPQVWSTCSQCFTGPALGPAQALCPSTPPAARPPAQSSECELLALGPGPLHETVSLPERLTSPPPAP